MLAQHHTPSKVVCLSPGAVGLLSQKTCMNFANTESPNYTSCRTSVPWWWLVTSYRKCTHLFKTEPPSMHPLLTCSGSLVFSSGYTFPAEKEQHHLFKSVQPAYYFQEQEM